MSSGLKVSHAFATISVTVYEMDVETDQCLQTWITVRALGGRLVTELLLLLLYDDHCNGYYHSGQHIDISSILGLWFTQELYGNMHLQVF